MDERERIGAYQVIVEECKGPNRNRKYVQESWYNEDDELHRLDGPAVTVKDLKGNIVSFEWYRYGQLHREGDEPAYFEDDGSKQTEIWATYGEPCRNDKPARVVTDLASGIVVEEIYYWRGHEHRYGGPARITRSPETGVVTSEHWEVLGKADRHDGPSFIKRDEHSGKALTEQWRQQGKLHRKDGPAVIYYSPEDGSERTRRYYNSGKRISDNQGETLSLDK